MTYEEFVNNRGKKLRISDIYYATINGMEMDSPGVYFAHNDVYYDSFPIRVNAFITGNESFWEKITCKKSYLYKMICGMAQMSFDMLEKADLNTIAKASEIIHDYGDFINHAVDVYKAEYDDFCQFAIRLSLLFYKVAEDSKQNRAQGLKSMEIIACVLRNYLLLIAIP